MQLWNRNEYRIWWESLTLWRRLFPALCVFSYWAVLALLGGLNKDAIVVALVPAVLYYLGPRYRPILQFLLPLILTGIIYDSMRYYADYIRGPVHVREPYEFDKKFFGISTAAGVLTPNEWFQLHTNVFLDFVCGLSYIIFVPVFVLCAAYFRFWKSLTGTSLRHPQSILQRSPQIMWAFFWVNIIGYTTYYWYAASPPWYVALYGLGPARLDIPANMAGCVRFDALVGMDVFKTWYSKSADVHGAIPSLHIAYPLIAVYYAFRFGSLRVFTVFFYVLMCFSAVYLNHHYIIDIIWGSAYALAVSFSMDLIWNWRLKREGGIIAGPMNIELGRC